jgi:hypothetical protein
VALKAKSKTSEVCETSEVFPKGRDFADGDAVQVAAPGGQRVFLPFSRQLTNPLQVIPIWRIVY